MSANIARNADGSLAMVHIGAVKPWWGLGTIVDDSMPVNEMATVAGLDWTAVRTPLMYKNPAWKFGSKGAQMLSAGRDIITRSDNGNILAQSVTDRWEPPANSELVEAMMDFVGRTGAQMQTIGMLGGGEVVWGSAKLGDDYKIANEIGHQHIFISASYKYGLSSRADFTNTLIVCENTFMAAMSDKSDHAFNMTHRNKYTAEAIGEWFKTGEADLAHQKAQADALLNAAVREEADLKMFYSSLFPLTSKSNVREKELSRNAEIAMVLNADPMQPGQPERGNTWWRAFNTVTYMVDHQLARNEDTRMYNATLGTGRTLKIRAMNAALKFAAPDAGLADELAVAA